jgi:hypothetical protein
MSFVFRISARATPPKTNRTSIAGITMGKINMLLSRAANTPKGMREARTAVKAAIKIIGEVRDLDIFGFGKPLLYLQIIARYL